MNSLDKLTEVKGVSKTIRFELKPYKATKEYLDTQMSMDFIRDENKETAKEELDREYKNFIHRTLEKTEINFEELYNAIMQNDEEKIAKEQKKCREEIVKYFKADDEYKILFKGDKIVDKILKNPERSISGGLEVFKKFTTYFVPFFENRKNIFTDEEKTTSLAYRAVNVNFSDFIINKNIFEQAKKDAPEVITELEKNMIDAKLISKPEELEEMFEVSHYNNFILQDGIKKLNTLIGGISPEKNIKIKGFNELAKEHNDKKDGRKRIPGMKSLKRQILSDVEGTGFKFEAIENDRELLEVNKEIFDRIKSSNVISDFSNLIENLEENDLEKIYLSDRMLNLISVHMFKDYKYLKENIRESLIAKATEEKGKKLSKKETKELEKEIGWSDAEEGKVKYISIKKIYENTKNIEVSNEEEETIKFDFISVLKNEIESNISRGREALEEAEIKYNGLTEESIKKEDNIDSIKYVLDRMLVIIRNIKDLTPKNISDIDKEFYFKLYQVEKKLEGVEKVYNVTRNYVTKAEFSSDKIKLNFNYPTLAAGWSKTKEKDNGAIIFRKDNKYYIGILNHFDKTDLSKYEEECSDCFEKMNYMTFKDPSKMFPKCMFVNDVKKHFEKKDDTYVLNTDSFAEPFAITKELFDTYQVTYDGKKKFQKDYLKNHEDDIEGYKKALITAIDGCKEFLSKYKTTKIYDMSSLKPSKMYNSIDEFYGDVSRIAYDMSFVKIPTEKIEEFVEDGRLLMFEIYCKDFSKYSTGKKNLHTMYFEALFSEENKKDNKLRLSGNAEIFFRKKSIEEVVTHEEGTNIVTKTYVEDGVEKSIPEDIIPILNKIVNDIDVNLDNVEGHTREEIEMYLEKAKNIKTLKNTIVKDKRYTVDKLFLHLPIAFNAEIKEKNLYGTIDDLVRSKKHNIIGIDRGERNLLYITVVNPEGKILLQKSMNIIEQKSYDGVRQFDYHAKLNAEEIRRKNARKSWKKIGKIKNFKEGYLSQAVHEICKLVIEYDAFIVMERLDQYFKRMRNGFEKQVYQKFENMLCNKLSYLVFKDRKIDEPGGVLNGYQLSDEYKENQIRNGIIFYVPAGYTSKIDPTTGFVNPFKLGAIKTLDAKKELLEKMDSIRYNKEGDVFEYEFNLDEYKGINTVGLHKRKWTVCTNGERIAFDIKTRKQEEKNITEILKNSLKSQGLELESGLDIKDIVIEDRKLLKDFYYGLYLALQMRNSKSGTDIDYIVSPVKNSSGEFYDSRTAGEELPKDADANGAYHIALKGNYILNKKYVEKVAEEKSKTSLTISNKEWFEYMQNR